MKRIIALPDIHMPIHDKKLLKAVIRCIGEAQPDEVVQMGDLMDFPQPSRWTKGTKEEFEGSIFEDSKVAQREFLEPLREVYDGPVGVIPGNHDNRGKDYLEKYAPALAETAAFNIETLLDFEKYNVELLPDFYEIAPKWVMTHGHLGGIRLSQIAGNTALNAAKKFDKSVIMGHCHRLGMGSYTTGYDGRVSKTVTGVEVGHLMDVSKVTYLRRGVANWQQGFAVVEVDGPAVQVDLVKIERRRFIYGGETFRV